MIDDNTAPTQVDRLRTLATMAAVYHANPKARMLWGRHYEQIGPYPNTFITADDGMVLLEGLVIDGDWHPDHGWDFDSIVTIITDDGEIMTIKGWLASTIEVL